MAFFTRVSTDVPFLPSDECHSAEEGKGATGEGGTKDDSENGSNEADATAGRYEYVVDRVLGVEV